MLALYHDWDSLCSFKVRLCLAEKNLEWRDRRVFLGGFEHIQPGYLDLNPNGFVPTLVHDGRSLIESTMINEYIDEVFPDPPLKPADPFRRAKMRVWVKYEDDMVHPAIRVASFQLMVKQRFVAMSRRDMERLVAMHPRPEAAQAYLSLAGTPIDYVAVNGAVAKLAGIIDRLEGALARDNWLAGEAYSLADVAMAPLVDRVEHLGFAQLWSDRPRVRGWIDRIKARPAYARALTPDAQRMPSPTAEMLAPLTLERAAATVS